MAADLFLLQILGYFLQTVPVAVLFWSEIPEEYLRIPYRKCLKNSFILLGILGIGFLILVNIGFSLKLESYQILENIYMLGVIGAFFLQASRMVSVEWKKFLIALVLAVQYEAILVNFNDLLIRQWMGTDSLYTPYDGANVLMLAVDNLVLFPMTYMLMTKIVRKNMVFIQGRILTRGCIYTVISAGIYIVAAMLADLQMTVRSALFLGLILICNVLMYVVYFSEVSLGKQQAQIEEQIQLVNTRYQMIRENIETTRRIRHDMRHQLGALRSMYEEKDWKSMGEFLRVSEDQLGQLEEQGKICQYPILDSLMRYYKEYADNHGIPMNLQIQVSREYGFHIMDMTALIGNCMENALEACQQIPSGKRWIQVEIKEVNNMLLFLVENSCKSQRIFRDGEYRGRTGLPSGKRQGEPGIGMKSVDLVVRKYNGMLFVRKEGEKFIVKIGLEIPDEKPSSAKSRGAKFF